MKQSKRIVVATIILVLTCGLGWEEQAQAQAQQFQVPAGPRPGVRGTIRIRNGRFGSVYREHWGGGLQPTGAAVLTSAIQNAPGIIQALMPIAGIPAPAAPAAPQGGDGDVSSPEDAAEIEQWNQDHEERMRRICDLKVRSCKALKLLGVGADQDCGSCESVSGSAAGDVSSDPGGDSESPVIQ